MLTGRSLFFWSRPLVFYVGTSTVSRDSGLRRNDTGEALERMWRELLNGDSHRLRAALPGFTGHDLDPMTGLYFAPFRYYMSDGVRGR